MYTHYPMNAQTPYMQQASIYGNPYQQRLEAITQQQAQQQSPQSNAQFVMVDGIEAARNTAVMPGQIASLEMDNRMYGVVRYPNGYTYSAGNSPFCACGNGCGCGCGNF